MKKKITKTIAIIVFVMFLGIKKVNAYQKNCVYKYTVDNKEQILLAGITDTTAVEVKIPEVDSSYFKTNWTKPVNNTTFTGQEYYNNGERCPSKVYLSTNITEAYAFFAPEDSSIRGAIQNSITDMSDLTGPRIEHILEASYYTEVYSKSHKSSRGIQEFSCDCSTSDNSYRIRYDVSANLTVAPRIPIKEGDGSQNMETILNWDYPSTEISGGTYTYLWDLIHYQKCSDKAFIKDKMTTTLNLADSNGTDANKFRDKGYYELSCKMVQSNSGNSNSNSNEPVDPGEDPGMDPNIPRLTPTNGTISCGNGYMTNVPENIPVIGKFIYNFLLILVPLIIIILGSIDLAKAIAGQKEDEVSKGKSIFIKRIIQGIIIFFAFAIAKLAISLATPSSKGIIACMDCILNNNSSCVKEQ